MVSTRCFLTSKIELNQEIKQRDDVSELERAHEFIAARKIQAWCRGFITRNHLRMLDQSATTIQRHWRGFMAREFARSHLMNKVTKMWWEHYHRCATKIQALWRGHKARKNGVSFPKYRRWLQSVYDKNTETSTRMKEFRDSESAYMRKLIERESMLWILFILFKLHHLLSTESQQGVLARIDKTRFTMIEKMMRSLEYTLYVEKRRLEKCSSQPPDAQPLLFEGTYFERCEKEIRDLERSLELGNGSIRRGISYEEQERCLKNVQRLRMQSESGKFGTKLPFRTVTRCTAPCTGDTSFRVTTGVYEPPKYGFTALRLPRDKSKELHGDFKVVLKPKQLYETIDKMKCPFARLEMKCPIHDFTPV